MEQTNESQRQFDKSYQDGQLIQTDIKEKRYSSVGSSYRVPKIENIIPPELRRRDVLQEYKKKFEEDAAMRELFKHKGHATEKTKIGFRNLTFNT